MITRSTDLLEKMRLIEVEMDFDGNTYVGRPIGIFACVRHGAQLRIIANRANEEYQWDHVSVSTSTRTPTWEEMDFVKNLFWDAEESVMQLHPPRSTWVNNHPYCLHLWKPAGIDIPLPPPILIGVKDAGILRGEKDARRLRKRIAGLRR